MYNLVFCSNFRHQNASSPTITTPEDPTTQVSNSTSEENELQKIPRYKTAWSTLIGRGMFSLVKSFYAIKDLLGALERKLFCLLLDGSLWHKG